MDGRQGPAWRLNGESAVVLVFLVAVLFYLFDTFSLSRTLMSDMVGPALFPQILAIFAIGLCALYFLKPAHRGRDDQAEAPRRSAAEELKTLLPILPVFLYVLILEPIGFLPATLIYCVITLRMFGVTWTRTLLYSVLATIIFFILFYYLLLTNLPMGRYLPTEHYLPFLRDLRRAIEM